MTMRKPKTTSAVKILHRRFIDSKERKASLEIERINAEVARMIYDLREEAGLSQKELAKMVGTTQSVISRLENADYEGHSLSILNRIAKALNKRLSIQFSAVSQETEVIRHVFSDFLRTMRRYLGLTVDNLAEKLDINRWEIVEMEHNCAYRPSATTLFKISEFYGLPQGPLAIIAGGAAKVPEEILYHASMFANQANSFSKLTKDERQWLNALLIFLKSEFITENKSWHFKNNKSFK